MCGWVKIHRKILDNPIFYDLSLFQLFIFCIISANHKPTLKIWNGKEEIIEKGSFMTGRKSLAEKLQQDENKIYRNLKILQKLNMISLKSNNKFTVVNVVRYSDYQVADFENEQQMNNKRTTTEQQLNTDKKYKNIKNKELKHMRASSEIYTSEFEEFYKNYPRKKDKGKAFKTWNARIKEKISPQDLIQAAKNYAQECKSKHTSEEYIKYPATFLSKDSRSWEDYTGSQRGSIPLTYEDIVTEEERLENERVIAKYANLTGGDVIVSKTTQ